MNEFRRCRFCGRVVLFNDDRHIAAHEGPPCEGWKKLLGDMVRAGFMRALPNEVHEVPAEILPAAPAGTATFSTCVGVGEPDGGKENDN